MHASLVYEDPALRPPFRPASAAEVFKSIVRCAATHVNPMTAERDADITKALFDHYGHMNCGVYVTVTSPGRVGLGDAATAPATEAHKEDARWA